MLTLGDGRIPKLANEVFMICGSGNLPNRG